jgi:nitroreductase
MDPEGVVTLLREHTSVRDYKDEDLPEGLLERLVAAAQHASTDATGQLYSVVRVRDPALRARVAEDAGGQGHVADAPEFLVFCLDVHRLRRLLEHRGERLGMRPAVALLFGVTDVALLAQSLVLAAEAHGLGACYIGGVQNGARRISTHLGLPEGVVPLWGLTLGYPAHRRGPKPRLPTRLVLHEDRYRDPTREDLDEAYGVMSKATRSGDWLNALRKYFAEGGVMARREPDFRALLSEHGLAL